MAETLDEFLLELKKRVEEYPEPIGPTLFQPIDHTLFQPIFGYIVTFESL